MAYVEVDIEDYLDEVRSDILRRELESRGFLVVDGTPRSQSILDALGAPDPKVALLDAILAGVGNQINPNQDQLLRRLLSLA